MLRIYSTDDTARASTLFRLLENAGIPAHVSGTYTAELNVPGLHAAHDLVNIWLLDTSRLDEAHALMIGAGFIAVADPASPPPAFSRLPQWLWVLLFACATVALGLLSF